MCLSAINWSKKKNEKKKNEGDKKRSDLNNKTEGWSKVKTVSAVTHEYSAL